MTIDLTPIEIEGNGYYTVKQFAELTHRSEQSVRLLISKGNRIRRLETNNLVGKPFIPVEELTNFPFTVSGHNAESYHYNAIGEVVI